MTGKWSLSEHSNIRFSSPVSHAVFTIRHRPTVHHHLFIQVERSDVADSYEAVVSVSLVALARHILAPDKPFKGLLRQDAAFLLLTFAGFTGLLHFRRIDAVEPDLGLVDVDGVAIDDAGFACEIVCIGYRRNDEQ